MPALSPNKSSFWPSIVDKSLALDIVRLSEETTGMLKADAISFFGSQTKFARELNRAMSTVSEYGAVLPIETALLTEKVTRRRLKVDFRLYDPDKLPPALRP